jgi:hypothetical protein
MTVPRNFIRDTSMKVWNVSSARLSTQRMMQPFWFAGPTIVAIRWTGEKEREETEMYYIIRHHKCHYHHHYHHHPFNRVRLYLVS